MSERRDDGYEVRYRLQSSRTRRGNLAMLGVGLAIAGWLAATLTAPRVAPVAVVPSGPTRAATSDALETAGPTQPAGPTFPPSVERLAEMRDVVIPAMGFDGLTWFDTAAGGTRAAVQPLDVDWAFTMTEGSVACICTLPSEADPGRSRVLRWYSPGGESAMTYPLENWPIPALERTVHAVAWDPAAAAFYLAWAVESPDGWRVRLRMLDSSGISHDTVTLADAAFAGPIAGEPVTLDLWMAPDGRQARVRFAAPPVAHSDGPQVMVWDIPTAGASFGRPQGVRALDLSSDAFCFIEGWATATQFMTACGEPGTGGSTELRVFLQPGDPAADPAARFVFPAFLEQPDWLLDQRRGRLYVWHPELHRIDWFDTPTRSSGSAEVSFEPALVPTAAWPPLRDGRTVWLPRGTAPLPPTFDQRGLVGSVDGSVIYAAGYRESAVGVRPAESTGIWAFDTEMLDLVGHWAPAGTYDALSMSLDGAYVIALGSPSPEEQAAFGNHGRTIAFHDRRFGELALLLRHQTSSHVFIVPEPFP